MIFDMNQKYYVYDKEQCSGLDHKFHPLQILLSHPKNAENFEIETEHRLYKMVSLTTVFEVPNTALSCSFNFLIFQT